MTFRKAMRLLESSTGLAWTQMGGEILFVESSVSGGKGVMTMTGNLGDVMKDPPRLPTSTSRPILSLPK